MANEKIQEVIKRAKEGMKNAFVPVSNFPTGSAILTDSGNIYHGGNVESVISGLGTCSERVAINNAVAHGEYCFKVIVVTTELEEPVKPCGMCLQYLAEFSQVANHDIKIIMVGSKGKTEKSSVNKMLPGAFGPRDLGLNLKKYECS